MMNAEHPTATWFETPRLRPPGYGGLVTMRVSDLILRSPPQAGVSKDEATALQNSLATAGIHFGFVAWQR
jgi:hypothetical protein